MREFKIKKQQSGTNIGQWKRLTQAQLIHILQTDGQLTEPAL